MKGVVLSLRSRQQSLFKWREVENGQMKDTPLNRKIWHFTNLQPLWHSENAKKSDSLIHLNEYYESIS